MHVKLLDYQSDASQGERGNSALGNKLVQSSVSWFQAKTQLVSSSSSASPQIIKNDFAIATNAFLRQHSVCLGSWLSLIGWLWWITDHRSCTLSHPTCKNAHKYDMLWSICQCAQSIFKCFESLVNLG